MPSITRAISQPLHDGGGKVKASYLGMLCFFWYIYVRFFLNVLFVIVFVAVVVVVVAAPHLSKVGFLHVI